MNKNLPKSTDTVLTNKTEINNKQKLVSRDNMGKLPP